MLYLRLLAVLLGALNKGITALGVPYGYGTADELFASGAGGVATSPDELPLLIAGSIGRR